jgi:AcrR family transcriptional regulator
VSSSPSSLPTTTKGRETRARLLSAARDLFAERGYAATSVVDITEHAGISNAAFYRYFADQRDLVLTLLRELVDDAYRIARAPWQERDPKASVLATTQRYFKFYDDNRVLFGLMMHLVPDDAAVVALWQESQQAFYERIVRAFRRGVEAGVIRADLDLRLMTELLAGMSEFYAFRRFAIGLGPWRSAAIDDAVETVSELWVSAMVPRA